MNDKTKGKELHDKLLKKDRNVWSVLPFGDEQGVFAFAEEYKKFLNQGKTERKAAQFMVRLAEESGFQPLEELIASGQTLAPGTKVYSLNRGKALIMAVIGRQPLEKGMNIIGAHLDAPRLDLKPNPLYEAEGLAWFKTHYYGGIKKYQWVTIPLALHGVIIKGDGTKIEVTIGEDEQDPVLIISDLLPHLAQEQMEKKMTEAITGEGLNLLIGSIPLREEDLKEKVKLAILEKLHGEYGIVEEDFISAELEAVPAGKARDVGLDRGIIGAYGQDDRVCSYAALRAILETGTPELTALGLFADKEETGSAGNTGMQSAFLENFVAEVIALTSGNYNELICRRALAGSRALSADVNAALDPNYEGVMEKMNASRLGGGVVLTKYTGSRGKSATSDANAEFVAYVRQLFNKKGIPWQTGELGAVDKGGGGTIAMFMANLGMDVLDCGVALLSMHAPMELASKGDVFVLYKGYKAFFQE
ncbi:MAG: aminopeptidase [Clostridia bacterium]|nr:aminopeptidase [Clostridia bacterium]